MTLDLGAVKSNLTLSVEISWGGGGEREKKRKGEKRKERKEERKVLHKVKPFPKRNFSNYRSLEES